MALKPPPMKAVTLRIEPDLIARLKQVVAEHRVGYQTLARELLRYSLHALAPREARIAVTRTARPAVTKTKRSAQPSGRRASQERTPHRGRPPLGSHHRVGPAVGVACRRACLSSCLSKPRLPRQRSWRRQYHRAMPAPKKGLVLRLPSSAVGAGKQPRRVSLLGDGGYDRSRPNSLA